MSNPGESLIRRKKDMKINCANIKLEKKNCFLNPMKYGEKKGARGGVGVLYEFRLL